MPLRPRATVLAALTVAIAASGSAAAAPRSGELPVRPVRVRATVVAGGPWAVTSTDRRQVVLYGLRGGVVHGPAGRPRRVALTGRPYRVAIAPDGARLAYTGEDAIVRVIDVATGAVQWQTRPGGAYSLLGVGFADSSTLIVTTACRVMRLDLSRPTLAPEPVGAVLCDEADPGGTLGEARPFGPTHWYRPPTNGLTARLLDVATGREHELPWTQDADVVVADDGAVVCAGQRYYKRPDVVCARPGDAPTVAIPGVPRSLALSADGHTLAALIERTDGAASLIVADPTTGGAPVELGTTDDRRMAIVGRDIVTSRGPTDGATVWRLDAGYRAAILPGDEIEYALAAPTGDGLLMPTARGGGEVFRIVRLAAPAPARRPRR